MDWTFTDVCFFSFSEDFFPNALDYYKGDEESGDEIDDDIELGSEDDEDDEDEHIQKKKK